MRVLGIVLLLLFVVAGVVFGALNAELVSYDLLLARVRLPKGAALIAAAVLGWLLGGLLVWLLSVFPLRRQLARSRGKAVAAGEDGTDTPVT